MSLPVLRIDRVYHIGTLNPDDLGRNSGGSSLEGRNLSVSLCPHAWQSIARLGGYPLHELSREAGLFVDMRACRERLPEIVAWAIAGGLVEEKALWRVWSFDDEADCWTWMTCASREEAEGEAEFTDGSAPGGHEVVEGVIVPVGTEALAALSGMTLRADEDATEAVMMAWATRHAQEADGLWWNETYSPETLSAPRGAIFQWAVERWRASCVDWSEVGDVEGPVATVSTDVRAAVGAATYC